MGVNEECYKALQAILPGYDYARLEAEKKVKGKKGGNANPVRKSNRQNDEAESEVSTSEVEQSSTSAIELGTSTPTPTPKGAAPRTASTRPARKSKNEISYNEDMSERQFLAKLKADEENQAPKPKAGPKSKKIKAEQKTEEINGTSDIKEVKTEIKTENSASGSSKPGPKSKKRKVEPETEVKKVIKYESSDDDDISIEIPKKDEKKKSKPGPKSKKQKADECVIPNCIIDTTSDIEEEIRSPKAGPSGLSAKKPKKDNNDNIKISE